MDETIKKIYDAIISGEADEVKRNIRIALDAKLESTVILNEGMISAMQEVGRQFEAGDCYVPEMLISARAMQGGMSVLKPYLRQSEIQSSGRVMIGTVKGDLHDLGKNLVALMLEGAGFEIKDLGVDVPAEDFITALKAQPADILALSALLTTTMPAMQQTIQAIRAAELGDNLKIMIGGAPVTEEYSRQIGADGYASDASRAVAVAQSLMKK